MSHESRHNTPTYGQEQIQILQFSIILPVMSENFVVLQLDTVNNHLTPLFEMVKAKGF